MAHAIERSEEHSDTTGEQPDNKGNDRLPKAELFNILGASRRLEVLRYLDRTGETATTGELAEHIASLECGCDRAQLSSQQRKRVYVGLYQCHLPKMADAGVIEYDHDRGTVALNERSSRLLKYVYLEEKAQSRGFVKRLFG